MPTDRRTEEGSRSESGILESREAGEHVGAHLRGRLLNDVGTSDSFVGKVTYYIVVIQM